MPEDDPFHSRSERPNMTIKFGSHAGGPPVAAVPMSADGGPGYRLGARLGDKGEVYEAHTTRFEGSLVLKLFPRATGLAASAVDAFSSDAVRASSLRHPHIMHVIEAGTIRDGTPFVAMEHLTGRTLEEQLRGRGAFLATELLPLIRGVAAALSAAHEAGLVHREVRPDNIFVAELAGYESGFVKVLDFGVCHLTAAQAMARRPLPEKTAHYFAPEQMGGARVEDVDSRADQFALAAIAYRMLSGTDPPVTNAAAAQSSRSSPGVVVMPLARRAPAVDAVVTKALSRLPEDRFESIPLFMRAFEEALAGSALISTPGPTTGNSEITAAMAQNAVAIHEREQALAGMAPSRRTTEVVEPWPPTEAVPRGSHPARRAEVGNLVERRSGPSRGHGGVEIPSLSQEFFDEGDRQEATRYKYAPLDSSDLSDSNLHFDSFDRIPTRRKPLLAAALIAIIGLVGLAWGAGLRPPDSWKQSELWQKLHLPSGAPTPVGAAAEGAEGTPAALPQPPAATATPPAAAPPAPVGAGPGEPTAPAPGTAAAPAPAANDLAPAATSPGSPTPAAPPAAAEPKGSGSEGTLTHGALSGAGAGDSPAAARPGAPAAGATTGEAQEPSTRAAAPAPKRPRPPAAARRGTPALRGYIWSPERQEMVPADGTMEPGPPASESPPPPPLALPDNRPGPPPFVPGQ